MNIQVIEKHSMKPCYLKKKIFIVTEIWKVSLMQIMRTQKEFVKISKEKREYHDLYVQSDTLLLADVFENFKNMCLEIYEPDPEKFFSAPRLAWQATFKKTKGKLDLLTDIDMLLMVKKTYQRMNLSLYLSICKS